LFFNGENQPDGKNQHFGRRNFTIPSQKRIKGKQTQTGGQDINKVPF